MELLLYLRKIQEVLLLLSYIHNAVNYYVIQKGQVSLINLVI